jgi:hypothetical protein
MRQPKRTISTWLTLRSHTLNDYVSLRLKSRTTPVTASGFAHVSGMSPLGAWLRSFSWKRPLLKRSERAGGQALARVKFVHTPNIGAERFPHFGETDYCTVQMPSWVDVRDEADLGLKGQFAAVA